MSGRGKRWTSRRKQRDLANVWRRPVDLAANNGRPIDQLIDVVERCPPTGNAISKMEPSESDLTNLNLPPWFATKLDEMASPNPIPSGFVVKNGSNIRSWSSAEIPCPESWTDINTVV